MTLQNVLSTLMVARLSKIEVKVTCRKNDWGEFIVQVKVDGLRSPDADYHTDDSDDAIKTAEAMRKDYRRHGHKVT